MATPVKKTKLPVTTLKAVEKLFGPVLPGPGAPEQTISVFQEYTSPKKYKLFGQPGLLEGAIWHLHTPLPLALAKIKGRISGIIEEGKQHDPHRQELATQWLAEHHATEAAKHAQTELKARKKLEAEAKRQGKAARAQKAAARAGEYDAELVIPSLNETLQIKVKIDAKGKITVVKVKGKPLQLPPID